MSVSTLASPAPDGSIHPDCKAFHRDTGMCICLMVQCAACEKRHAPHKECPTGKAKAARAQHREKGEG